METNLLPIKFTEFKNIIKDILNELDSLHENEIKTPKTLENEKDLFLEFIFLRKYQNFININLNKDIKDNELLSKEFAEIKIFGNKNIFYNDTIEILFHMFLLLLNKIEEILSSVYKKLENEPNKREKQEINKSYIVIIQIINLVSKLYKCKIVNLKKILIFFDVIIIFINKVSIICDKYMKLKNIIFLDLLFDKLYILLLKTILNDENINTENLSLFIKYLIDSLKNKKFGTHFNYSILVKNNIPIKIINIFFDYINYPEVKEIFIKYKDSMIDCLSNVYKNKLNQSNFFAILINQNKNSFINLMNYETKTQSIFKDIFMTNFYLELLNKIYLKEKELYKIEKEVIPSQSYFLFNGFDSKMIFNLDSFSLNNSIIFFSFRLSTNITELNSTIFPLIIFEESNIKTILFEILIKCENGFKKLYITQGQKKHKEICLNKINNISADFNYFLAIYFKDKKANICVSKNGLENYNEEIEIYEIDNKKTSNIRMKIGNEYKYSDNKAFEGYIGPLIILKDLKINKKINKNDIIKSIFDLKSLYNFLPFFITKESVYNFDYVFEIYSSEEKNLYKTRILNLKENIESFKCQLYLTPEIINVYYSLYLKNNSFSEIPNIPHISYLKNDNVIEILNVSTMIKGYILEDFLKNNGLDYICLVYEYLYQIFYSIQKNEDEFFFLQNDDNIKNNIENIIKTTLLILNNYTYYRYIINYQKKFKNLFRNLFDMLKCSNKLSNKIYPGISKEIYDLFFAFNNEAIQLKKSSIANTNNKKLIYYNNKIISPFAEGLIDMIFSPYLYEGYEDKNLIYELFRYFYSLILFNKQSNKIFPFKNDYIFKVIYFGDIIMKDYNQENSKFVALFGELVNAFLHSIKLQNKEETIRKLFRYIIKNYEQNLIVIKTFFNFIYEILFTDYFFEDDDITQVFNYYSNINKLENEKIDKELIKEINMIISKIIIKLLLGDNSGEMMVKLSVKLGNLSKNDIILSNIISDLIINLENILYSKEDDFIMIFLYKKIDKNNKINYYMNFFEIVFNFIIDLFKLLTNNYLNNALKEEKDLTPKDNSFEKNNYNILVDFLVKLPNILESKLTKDKKNILSICCTINFLKFYHHIIFENRIIILYPEKEITKNIIKVLEIINKFHLINCCKKLEFTYKNYETKKSIIEIVFEILIKYFLNDANNSQCYEDILWEYDLIFYDRKFRENGKRSIFYVNDMIRYIMNKKKTKLAVDIKSKCQNLQYYNELFLNYEEFEGNFSTYFLNIIIQNQNNFQQKKFSKAPISKLNKFLDELTTQILEEQKEIYNIDKKYFFKSCSINNYNDQITYIKDKYIKKEIPINDVKEFYKINFTKSITIDQDNTQRNKLRKGSNPEDLKGKQVMIFNEINYFNIFQSDFEFPKDFHNINKIHYFFDLDKNYITNIKKEIMNSIFSVYYLDEFFYSEDFCTVKKYYINHYLINKESQDSKKLNFPSIIKNYTNNFGPPLFLKKFNNYITDIYFEITHSFIKTTDTLLRHINMKKSIKLNKKEYSDLENVHEIECELLRDEKACYGKLFYSDSEDYLLFKEQEKDLLKEEGFKYIFLLSYLNQKNEAKSRKKTKILITKKYDKNIFILKENIEEIVEIRIFLLWKGIEIYLKNGKSYLFNFLSTKDYDNFSNNFISKNKIKNVLRKRDFLKDKNEISKDWSNGLITNFEYLLLLNRYGSRSFHDPTQYPVFPWVLDDYKNLEFFVKKKYLLLKIMDEYERFKNYKKDKQIDNSEKVEIDRLFIDNLKNEYKGVENFLKNKKDVEIKEISKDKYEIKSCDYSTILNELKNTIKGYLRDFIYPTSFQDEEKRNDAKLKFEQDLNSGDKFPIHSGFHYSTCGYIYFYLMRQQPYGNMLVKLQSYNLENTDRCFANVSSLQSLTKNGCDNRELIPEFFSKIELFLNLNCDCYGKQSFNNEYLDDCTIDVLSKDYNKNSNITYLSKFVTFIIDHKRILNSKIIGLYLQNWIYIIFGEKQLLDDIKKRNESCAVFSKYSYEKKINLEEKLEKKKKENLTEEVIINKIYIKSTYIVNFGVVPSCLFTKPHKKLKLKAILNNDITNVNNKGIPRIKTDYKKNKSQRDNKENQDLTETDLESFIINNVSSPDNDYEINKSFLLFKIDEINNKIFIYDRNDNLLICNCEIFNEFYYNDKNIYRFYPIDNVYISNHGDNYLYQINYSFSPFDKEKMDTSGEIEEYHTYHYKRINILLNKEKMKNELKNQEKEIIKLITCRHLDFSFKIYYIIKYDKKSKITHKIFSYICEDFVTSCCCINSNAFVVGLNNGKLIYFKINFNINNIIAKKNNIEFKEDIKIEKEKYIEGHNGKINVIEIDKRLGIIATAGDDNYIFIRKIYDFELLLPIKIKNKFEILMLKISSFNFIYVLCLNKNNKKKIIFGYTLSGLKFAKSEYGFYDNISFNEEGDLITLDNKKNIRVLSGNTLNEIKISNLYYDKEIIDNIKKIEPLKWIQYNYLVRSEDDYPSRIFTFFEKKEKEKNKDNKNDNQQYNYFIRATNLSEMKK